MRSCLLADIKYLEVGRTQRQTLVGRGVVLEIRKVVLLTEAEPGMLS